MGYEVLLRVGAWLMASGGEGGRGTASGDGTDEDEDDPSLLMQCSDDL